MSDTSRPISTNDAFCELLKLAIDRAPDPEAKATIQSLLLTHCSARPRPVEADRADG
jgi:hypothetical protein